MEYKGESTYGMSALTGPRFRQASEMEAAELWRRSMESDDPFWWVRIHAVADTVFAAIYGVALYRLVRKLTDFVTDPAPLSVRALRWATDRADVRVRRRRE